MQKLENKKRVFALVVLYGFETKNFFGSGMYKGLSKEHEIVILRRDFPTENFDEYIEAYNLNVTILDKSLCKKDSSKIESLLLASRRARKRVQNENNFNYFKSDRNIKWADYILGNVLVNNILEKLALESMKKSYSHPQLDTLYNKYGITDLLIAGYSSKEAKALAVTALNRGSNVWLVINSWKDFYVNDLLAFHPTKTFAWSEQMKEQIITSNSHINSSGIIVSGNPSFDRFFHYMPVHSKEYYAKKYRFNVVRPLMLYSMISPQAYAYEKEIIELINQKLIDAYPNEKQRPIILLRRNPIDETVADESFYSGDNVRYADNYFEGSYEDAVFVQLQEGEVEWMDLLHHADININIASTVTLESLMMGTPVINVEFGKDGTPNADLKRYAEAPFYKPLLERKDVAVVDTIELCFEKISAYLQNDIVIEPLDELIGIFDGKATQRIVEVVGHD